MVSPAESGSIETWALSKPALHSRHGVIASQHRLASQAGAAVLRAGGNAVDAAVSAALLIATVEPWMSGIGGGGVMLIHRAAEQRTYAVDFTILASRALDPADYPLLGSTGGDLFGWPAVREDRNVLGPLSMAVPGNIAGLALALERFGTLDFASALTPAIEQAHRGLAVDWYATLHIASAAAALSRFEESRRVFLPDGHAPCGEWGGPLPVIRLGRLAQTLERLRAAGPRDFYEGEVARQLVTDIRELGGRPHAEDLASYQAQVLELTATPYREHRIFTTPGLSAGPTMQRALAGLQAQLQPGAAPDEQSYAVYADTLAEAYAHRLRTLGDADEQRAPSCTTHLSVADAEGNVVALTQTLLSLFGSKVMLPRTGVLMNNGVMWFDPRPGQPNSMAPGKRGLANMCPTIVERSDGARFALGASGGRRIFPAVLQLSSFLTDFGMDLDQAFQQPRIDVSTAPQVSVDRRLPASLVARLQAQGHQAVHATHGVYPALFACPNGAGQLPDGRQVGAAFIASPWAQTVSGEG